MVSERILKDSPAIQLRPSRAYWSRPFGLVANGISARLARGAQVLNHSCDNNLMIQRYTTMKRILCTLSLFALVLAAQAKLNVVATLPDFGALAQEIGGDKIKVA